MFARYASAISSGTVMTLGLIYLMQLLISMQPYKVIEPPQTGWLDFIRIERPDSLIADEYEIPPLEDLTTVYPAPATPQYDGDTIATGVPLPNQPADGGYRSLPSMNALGDGPAMTVMTVQPVYPAVAIQRGIEGYAIVEFDVLGDGKVVNIRVIESTSSLFNKSAIQAAARLKFKPGVRDGIPYATTGLRKKFTFELEQ